MNKKNPILSLLGICVLAALACELAPTSVPSPLPATATVFPTATLEIISPSATAAPSETPTETPTTVPTLESGFEPITAANIADATHQSLILGEEFWTMELVWPAANRLALWLPEAVALQEIVLQPLELMGMPQSVDVPGMVLAIAPDGSSVAAQGGDGGLIVMDRASGEIRALDYGVAYGASYDPSGQVLAVFSPDEWTATLFDVTSAEAIGTVAGFETAAPVYSVYPAGRSRVVWIARATAQFQDVATGLFSPRLGYMEFINTLAFSPDGETLALSAGFRFDLIPVPAAGEAAQPVTLLDQSLEVIYGTAFSPDGRLIAAGQGSRLRVWDVETHAALADFPAGEEKLRLVSFSPDGTAIVALDNANVLHVWRVGP